MGHCLHRSNKINEVHRIECILPFLILLSQYKVGSISVAIIALFVSAVIVLQRSKWKVHILKHYRLYLIFLAYVVLRDILRIIQGPDDVQMQLNRMAEYLIMYFFVFVISSQEFSEDKLYKVWKVAGVFFSIGLIYQVLQIYVLRQHIAPISLIPGYVLRPADKVIQSRPSSFFAEPASFVNAMIPFEFLALKRKDFKWAVFSTIEILLSGSTVGVILSIVLWAMELVSRDNSFGRRALVFFIAIIIVALFINLKVFQSSFTKFLEVASGESTFGSRVLTGFEIVRRQSIIELIFGTNYNDVANFVTNHAGSFTNSLVVMTYWSKERLFLNTFSDLIFRYGIIGFGLFLNPLFLYLKQPNYEAKMLVVMTLVAIFGQSMLLNTFYFMLIIIFLLYDKKY